MNCLRYKFSKAAIHCLLLLFCFLWAGNLSAQYVDVSGNSGDGGGRSFAIYLSGSFLHVRGQGFENVELSDYELGPINADSAFVRASQGNVNSPRGGVGLGFVTVAPGSFGAGLEAEIFYFDDPRLWNVGAFVNFDLLGRPDLQFGPYLKLGVSGLDMFVGNVQTEAGGGNINLRQIRRFHGRGAVDVRAGDELSIIDTSFYYQAGLQLSYRLSPMVGLFSQIGYSEAYYRDFKLRVTGAKSAYREGTFDLDADDPAIVKPGTTDPANLDPQIRTGPLYLSVGISYIFSTSGSGQW